MPRRTIVVDGETWEVYPSGRVTVYGRDQVGLVFQHGTGPERRRRVTRYAPLGGRAGGQTPAALSDRELETLFRASQPAWTAPEASYGTR